MAYADQQAGWGNYNEAISLYRRVLFFDTLNNSSAEVCKKLASCYIVTKDYVKAREFSKIAGNLANNDSVRNEMIFQTAYLYLLENDYNYALIELYGINDLGTTYFESKKNFYLGVALFQQTDYKESREYFAGCIDSADKESLQALNDVFDQIKKIDKRYNPKTAKILSIFIPGSGQVYSGDFKGSVNSLILTAGLAALYINSAINYTFIDATVSILPWLQRYYQGGYENAARSAIIKKERKIKEQYHQVISVIEKSKL